MDRCARSLSRRSASAINKPLIGSGNFEYQVAVLVLRSANEEAAVVEELNLGLKDGPSLFHHLHGDIGPAAVNFVWSDGKLTVSREGHLTRLPFSQIEDFAAEQSIRRVVEHGLQFADVLPQLWINTRAIPGSENRFHADPAAVLGCYGERNHHQ